MAKASFFGRLSNSTLDATIVRSFDKRGFARHQRFFDAEDLQVDMSGRVCLVTGANSGLGYATCQGLAARGASVWMICRNAERGAAAQNTLQAEFPDADIHLALLDVSDLSAIRAFCEALPLAHIDVLVHNAGILPAERGVSADGLDHTLATNLVGPFALTHGLLARLRQGDRPRIIWVSSGGMYSKKLSVKRLAHPPDPFDGVTAYADTKRGMAVASEFLAEQLLEAGIAVHCMHPGWADTPGVQTSIPTFWERTQDILRTSAEGADTIVWLAVCDKAQSQSGRFWFDRSPKRTHLLFWTSSSPAKRKAFFEELHRWAQLPEDAFLSQ